ncbi:unnamed protein product, partial [Closterium sp. NIES-54]
SIFQAVAALPQQPSLPLPSLCFILSLLPLSYYLGFHITRDRTSRTLHLHQSKFITSILDTYSFTPLNPAATPMDTKFQPPVTSSPHSSFPYTSFVGSIMYPSASSSPSYLPPPLLTHVYCNNCCRRASSRRWWPSLSSALKWARADSAPPSHLHPLSNSRELQQLLPKSILQAVVALPQQRLGVSQSCLRALERPVCLKVRHTLVQPGYRC